MSSAKKRTPISLAAATFTTSSSFIGFSAVAAGFVGNDRGGSAAIGPSTLGVAPQPLYTGNDPDLALLCKRLLKSDPRTKLKALRELSAGFTEGGAIDGDAICDALPHLAFLYLRLNADANWRVRDNAQQMLLCLLKRDRKAMRSVIPAIVGSWWAVQCDPSNEVSKSARAAMAYAFQAGRIPQVLTRGIESICDYLIDLLFDAENNVLRPSQEERGESEDGTEKLERCAVMGLAALARLMGDHGLQLPVPPAGQNSEVSANYPRLVGILRNRALWGYLRDSRDAVRRAAYKVLTTCSQHYPVVLPENLKRGSLELITNEKIPRNHADAWEAALSVLKQSEGGASKASIAAICKACNNGHFAASSSESFPCLLPLMSCLFASSTSKDSMDAAMRLLNSIWQGLDYLPKSVPCAVAAVTAYAECAVFVALRYYSSAQPTTDDTSLQLSVQKSISQSFTCFSRIPYEASVQSVHPLSSVLARFGRAATRANSASLDICWTVLGDSMLELVNSSSASHGPEDVGNVMGNLLREASELDPSTLLQKLCSRLFDALRPWILECKNTTGDYDTGVLPSLGLLCGICESWKSHTDAGWPPQLLYREVSSEASLILTHFLQSQGTEGYAEKCIVVMLRILKCCILSEAFRDAGLSMARLLSITAKEELRCSKDSQLPYTAEILTWALELSSAGSFHENEDIYKSLSDSIFELAQGPGGDCESVIRACLCHKSDAKGTGPFLVTVETATLLLEKESAVSALLPAISVGECGDLIEPMAPTILARAFLGDAELWGKYGLRSLRRHHKRFASFIKLAADELKAEMLGLCDSEYDALYYAAHLMELAEVETSIAPNRDPENPFPSLFLSGITDAATWRSLKGDCRRAFVSDVMHCLLGMKEDPDSRLVLLQRGTPSADHFIAILGEFLYSRYLSSAKWTAERQTTISKLLFSAEGGARTWEQWKMSLLKVRHGEDAARADLPSLVGLAHLAESLAQVDGGCEPSSPPLKACLVYRIPDQEALIPGAHVWRVFQAPFLPQGDEKDASISRDLLDSFGQTLEMVSVICLHQDPEGGEPYVTVASLEGDKRERQTPLSRLRILCNDLAPMKCPRGSTLGVPNVSDALQKSTLPLMAQLRTRIMRANTTAELEEIRIQIEPVCRVLSACMRTLGCTLVGSGALQVSLMTEWSDWEALVHGVVRVCQVSKGTEKEIALGCASIALGVLGSGFSATPFLAHFSNFSLSLAAELIDQVISSTASISPFDLRIICVALDLVAASCEAARSFPPPLLRKATSVATLGHSSPADRILCSCLQLQGSLKADGIEMFLSRALVSCMKFHVECRVAFPEPALALSAETFRATGKWIAAYLTDMHSRNLSEENHARAHCITQSALMLSRCALDMAPAEAQWSLEGYLSEEVVVMLLSCVSRGSEGSNAASLAVAAYSLLSVATKFRLTEDIAVQEEHPEDGKSCVEKEEELQPIAELQKYLPDRMIELFNESILVADKLQGHEDAAAEVDMRSAGGEGSDCASSDSNASNLRSRFVFLTWMLFLDFAETGKGKESSCGETGRFRQSLHAYLREAGALNAILPVCLNFLGSRKSDASASHVLEDFLTEEQRVNFLARLVDLDEVTEMPFFASTVFIRTALEFPSLVRSWFVDDAKHLRNKVSRFTERFVTEALVAREVRTVQNNPLEMTVRASTVTREISACYVKDECSLEMTIKLPCAYPLQNVEIVCNRRLGISEDRWRRWMLQIVTLLGIRDGSVLDAILFWKRCVDREFDGMEPCVICYCTLHPKTMALPTLSCRTCSNGFHSICLYKWFDSSHKSQCPLCQQPWVN